MNTSAEILVSNKTGSFFESTFSLSDEDGDTCHYPSFSESIDQAMCFSVNKKQDGKTPAQIVNDYFSGEFEIFQISLKDGFPVVGFTKRGTHDVIETNPKVNIL